MKYHGIAIILIPCASPEIIFDKKRRVIACLFFIRANLRLLSRIRTFGFCQKNKILNLEITISKLEKYCSYSEKCKSDIIKKLGQWKIFHDHDEIINHLIDHNYINEERYALLYCMGKFNSRRWGKVKISNHLIQKGIKNEYIQNAIMQISDEKYNKSLTDLINYKSNQISDNNIFNRNSKITKYLYQKGYELDLIWEKIKIISKDHD